MVTAFLQPVHTQRAAGEQGILPQGCMQVRFAAADERFRDAEAVQAWHLVEATLKRGEGAYVHCLAGVHRGPLAAGVMLAAIHGGDMHRATTMIQDARAVELHRMWTGGRHSQDNWGWATSRFHAMSGGIPLCQIEEESTGPAWSTRSSVAVTSGKRWRMSEECVASRGTGADCGTPREVHHGLRGQALQGLPTW